MVEWKTDGGLDHKNFHEIKAKYHSNHRIHRYELVTKINYAHLNQGSINSVDIGATYQSGILGT